MDALRTYLTPQRAKKKLRMASLQEEGEELFFEAASENENEKEEM